MSVAISCRRCGQDFTQAEMRLDANGSDMLCKSCYARTHDEKGKKIVAVSYEDPDEDFIMVKAPKPSPQKPSGPSNRNYRCLKCNFKFSRSADKQVHQCPYCGDSKVVSYEKLDAHNLLKEASSSKYDF